MSGRLLAIDPGTKRLGFALSDDLGWTARPLEVWTRKSPTEDVAHIVDLVEQHEVVELVVGVPYRLDGSESRSTAKSKALIAEIKEALPDLPILEKDEALTTWEAEERLKEKGLLPKDRRKVVDAYAALVILQEELDARSNRLPAEHEPLD